MENYKLEISPLFQPQQNHPSFTSEMTCHLKNWPRHYPQSRRIEKRSSNWGWKQQHPNQKGKKDDDNYEDYSDEQNNFEEKAAQEKVDNDDKNKANHVVQDPQDPDYDANDGLKGIFIDIESGEVTVMKPVAELTSFLPKKEDVPSAEEMVDLDDLLLDEDGDGVADKEVKRKSEIFSQIQTELKKNYDKMKKDHERVEAKKRRKEILASKGMDESVDVVSKYFDMVEDDDDNDEPKS